MDIFLACLVIVVALFGLCWITFKAADSEMDEPWPWLALLGWAGLLTLIVMACMQDEQKGPCVSYETQIHWNAATKTMMPARICVQRGEWIKPGEEQH